MKKILFYLLITVMLCGFVSASAEVTGKLQTGDSYELSDGSILEIIEINEDYVRITLDGETTNEIGVNEVYVLKSGRGLKPTHIIEGYVKLQICVYEKEVCDILKPKENNVLDNVVFIVNDNPSESDLSLINNIKNQLKQDNIITEEAYQLPILLNSEFKREDIKDKATIFVYESKVYIVIGSSFLSDKLSLVMDIINILKNDFGITPSGAETGMVISDSLIDYDDLIKALIIKPCKTIIEGEEKRSIIGGNEHNIKINIINSNEPYSIKMVVDGESIEAGLGDIVTLKSGDRLLIQSIIPNEIGDITQDSVRFCINEEQEVTEPIIIEPSCSDNIKNGDETGIDCGGSCPPCKILDCFSIESDSKRDACYMDKVLKDKEYSACSNIVNLILRESCCNSIDSDSHRDSCYFDCFLDTGKKDICSKIVNENLKISCYGESEFIDFSCNGCKVEDICYQIGHRKEGNFCSDNKEFISQKEESISCDNNFECKSNLCIDNECIESGFFKAMISWFKNLFS